MVDTAIWYVQANCKKNVNYYTLVYTAFHLRLIKATISVILSFININKAVIIIENYRDDLTEKIKSTTRTNQLNRLKNILIIYIIMRSHYGKV